MKTATLLLVILLLVLFSAPAAKADCPVGYVDLPIGQFLYCWSDGNGNYTCEWQEYSLCIPLLPFFMSHAEPPSVLPFQSPAPRYVPPVPKPKGFLA